jgi:glycosyltransferase involved in cell wall biosynthesis
MKILQIIPGSGGSFYCGNCLRDSKYVDALRAQGHEVLIIPMYLPLFSHEKNLAKTPVFYGAVSIYLKQLYPLFRKAPAWFDRFLNSRPVLKLAAGFAGSTRAKGLDEMTISMLLGEEGKQKEELEKMVEWIAEHISPDIIHISNALLLGLAKKLREVIKVPVICSLQDEDTWVNVMNAASKEKVWKLMATKADDVDVFIAVSDSYRDVMRNNMSIPAEKLFSVHIGVDPGDYEYTSPENKQRTIGFISRLCEDNGLDILVDAFILLRRKSGFDDVNLLITGGSTGDDAAFIKSQIKKIKKAGLSESVHFQKEFEGDDRKDFFRKVSLISVPVKMGEAFGIYLLEAMASGVPVIQPALGAFPEIVNTTKGGILYEPNTPEKLSEALASTLSDSEEMNRLSLQGRAGVENSFDISTQAAKMVGIYGTCIRKHNKVLVHDEKELN